MLASLIGFAIALVIGFLTAPLVRRWAWRLDFVDRPDANRKVQSSPVAFGGGIVLAIACVVPIAVFSQPFMTNAFFAPSELPRTSRLGLLIASVIVLVIGFLDDRYGVRGKHKLFWQIVAALVATGSGNVISNIDVLGFSIPLGIIGFAIPVIWVLGSINAFNLIDGVDGLASSVGLVISLALGAIFLRPGHAFDAFVVFSLAGALMAFLRFNVSPASMYLGDTGSMLIGLVLGTLALQSAAKESATMAAAPLLAIWAILILDSVAAVARRKLTGRSIYDCDRGHLHHRLLENGLSANQTTLVIAGLCSVTSVAAIVSVYRKEPFIAVGVALIVLAVLASTKVFGHVELGLVGRRLLTAGRNSLKPLRVATVETVQLQGHRQSEKLWEQIVEAAEAGGVGKVVLNIHVARKHQDFFAKWTAPGFRAESSTWEIDRPFVFGGVAYGRVVASGPQDDDLGISPAEFCGFLDSLAPQFRALSLDAVDQDEFELGVSAAVN